MNNKESSTAFVAIVGRPNAGKSSLLNKLIGEKVAIVTSKPQTTRTQIKGVLTKEETQLVFIDTPGVHKPKNKLGQYMVKQVNNSVADVDVAILVIDGSKEINKAEKDLIEGFSKAKMPAILAINKIDLLEDKTKIMDKILSYGELLQFDAVVPISALKGDGVEALLKEVCKFAIPSPHFFPDDTLTDQPERVIMSEIIREKILKNLHEEIPHGTAVVIEKMKEREDGSIIDIDATILCERDSHKGMVIGKGGAMLKRIATHSREDMEAFMGTKINLQCWVKVKEDWRNKDVLIKTLGYE